MINFRAFSLPVLLLAAFLHAGEYDRPLQPPWRSMIVAEVVAGYPVSLDSIESQTRNEEGKIIVGNRAGAPAKVGKLGGPTAARIGDDTFLELLRNPPPPDEVDRICAKLIADAHALGLIQTEADALLVQAMLGNSQYAVPTEMLLDNAKPPKTGEQQLAALRVLNRHFDMTVSGGNADLAKSVVAMLSRTSPGDPLLAAAYSKAVKRTPEQLKASATCHEASNRVAAGLKPLPGDAEAQAYFNIATRPGGHADSGSMEVLSISTDKALAAAAKATLNTSGDADILKAAAMWDALAESRADVLAPGLVYVAAGLRKSTSTPDRLTPDLIRAIRRVHPILLEDRTSSQWAATFIQSPPPKSVVFVLDPSLRETPERWTAVKRAVLDEISLLREAQTFNVVRSDAGGKTVLASPALVGADANAAALVEALFTESSPATGSGIAGLHAALKLNPETILYLTSAAGQKPKDRQDLIQQVGRANKGVRTMIHCVLIDDHDRASAESLLDLATLNGGTFWAADLTGRRTGK